MKNVTLFTDASWDPKRQIGGWAAWANMDVWDEPKTSAGTVDRVLISGNSAELYAIYRSIEWLCRIEDCRNHLVLVRSDNSRALRLLLQCCDAKQSMTEFSLDVSGKRNLKLLTEDLWIIEQINTIRQECRLLLSVRHVYGHIGHDINSLCDRLAKQYMKTRRGH